MAISKATTLVLGGRGKVGRRVAARLGALGMNVRIGSRSSEPRFDWHDQTTWVAALRGVDAVFLAYAPDIAAPGAAAAIEAFSMVAVHSGVRRVVLLSRRGSREAEHCDAIVRRLPVDWTLLRSSWLVQTFSEGFLLKPVLRGEVALPIGELREPFVDADDVADVAAAALTEGDHAREVYDLTGSRVWTFRAVIDEIALATQRRIRCVEVSLEQLAKVLAADMPAAAAELTVQLFADLLTQRSAVVAAGVPRALGRLPRELGHYVRDTAATELWSIRLTPGGSACG